ncbi:MAG TPA: serine hydrolase [Steroidobacteraceae bacterium]|nr:serine hydrolase [Steroidobacteraceae bacterium]
MTLRVAGRPRLILAALSAGMMFSGAAHAADPAPCGAGGAGERPLRLEDKAELEAWLSPVVACEMAEGHVPGAVVAVVKDGAVILSKGFGVADIASGRPVIASKSLFRIASVTKTITATAIMQLVERGKLSLDTDARRVIDFPLRLTSDRPISIADLLTHRGGFESGLFGVLTERTQHMPPLRAVLEETIPTQVRPPGTLSSYSNHGFTLLAYVAERTTGMPFGEYLQANVFRPLGMAHTTFAQPLPDDLAPDVVTEYEWTQGRLVPHAFETVLAAGGGAVSSTGDDMARFMLAHLNLGSLEGHRILAEDTARKMHAVHFAYAPDAGGMGYGFPHMTYRGHDVLWHTGALYYSYARLSLIPDARMGIFIAVNSDWGADLIDNVTLDIMNRYLPAPASPGPPPPRPHALAEYEGYYRSSGTPITTFAAWKSLLEMAKVSTVPGLLRIERNGRVEEFVPSGTDRFRPKAADPMFGDAVFFRDSTGAIAGYSPENRATSCMQRVRAAARTPRVGLTLLALIGVGMAGALLAVSIASIRRRPGGSTELAARLLAAVTAAGFFAVLFVSPRTLAAVEQDSSFVSWPLRWYLAGTTALGVLTVGAVLAVAWSAAKGNLRRMDCGLRALWCVAALLQIWMLGYWNLLGFHYY